MFFTPSLQVLSVLLTLRATNVGGESILFYFASSSDSHKITVWPLVQKLLGKGHEVTFLSSPFSKASHKVISKEDPNLKFFHPQALSLHWTGREQDNRTRDVITSRVKGFSDGQGYWDGVMTDSLEICRITFRSLEMKKWLEGMKKFDLVIVDTPYNECGLGLAYKFNAPVILFGATSLYMWHQEMFGLPDETSWLPNFYHHFPTEMSFFQRVRNALSPLQWFYTTNRVSYIMPQMMKLLQKTLNLTDLPAIDELEKGASLFLLNTHFSQEYPRSLPPFVVPVGGMHLLSSAEESGLISNLTLPPDLVDFLDELAEDGFLYVNFGNHVKLSRAPAVVIEKFLNAFIVLQIPIVWRWDDVEKAPKERPKRIFVVDWVPQNEILAHPKIKGFITTGGTLNLQEAIFYGVPVVAFPLTPEEDYNAVIIEQSGIGLEMEIGSFTQYELATNIKKIFYHEMFVDNAKRLSELFKDRPQDPSATALWWTEYVLRHKNLSLVKPLSIHQSWFARRSLDVWIFLCLVLCISLIVVLKSVNHIFCKSIPPSPKPQKQKQKAA